MPELSEIPADIYLSLASKCEEVKVKQSDASPMLVRAKVCCFCAQSVKLGNGSADHSLIQHMYSRKCQLTQKKLRETKKSAAVPLEDSKATVVELSPQELTASLATHHANLIISASPSEHELQSLDYSTRHPISGESMNCPGAFYDYGMSMFSHYPWHLHDTSFLDYEFSFIDPKGRFFYVQSCRCAQKSPGIGAACKECNQVVFSRQFQELLKRANPKGSLSGQVNTQYRTYSQLCELLEDKNSRINTLQLTKISSERRIQSLSGRMDNQKQLMFALAQHDEFAVGRIIQTALRNKAGVKTVVKRLALAHQGLFSPRLFTETQLDASALIWKIGGPRLAFSMARALHLPSVRTVRKHVHLPRLKPCLGFPTEAEVSENIESFFGPDTASSGADCGVGISVLMDEVATEPRPRYSVEQDAVVGICREHTDLVHLSDLSTRSDALDSLLEAHSTLESGSCHRAAEATMVAIARFGKSDYNASIILASPTCKNDKHPKHAELIGVVLDSWRKSPYGATVHGDIWCICTDGDAGRRIAIFQHCMTSSVRPGSELYHLLGHLPLFNLCCGPNYITHDGDYKHEEKRMASALRSRSGIIVNGTQITPKMMVHYLRQLEDLSESRILSFFDGTDPQNVPKANALLTSMYNASQLPSILSQTAHKPFALLGEVLGSFVVPYTTLTMSLKQQLVSLAKCAHLLFALYRLDGTRFLTGQLIYDIQASIKNVFFCVAKTQLVNPKLPFYLLQTGTDRLESRFGTFRTVTSDRNGDILQMCERAASAQQIDEIYAARPRWNRVPYRLSMDGNSGIDHTNPASWKGDVTVGSVDLYSCWLDGRSEAAEILTWAGASFEFDPAVLSIESLQIDVMRPHGKYPGIQVDTIEINSQPVRHEDLVDSAQTFVSTLTEESSDRIQPLRIGDDELSIEHLLPTTPNEPTQSDSRKGWILVDGQRVHLESAVRYVLGLEGGPRSTDRLRRICGYTRYLNPSAETQSVLGNDFHVSELVATFLLAQNRVSIAIIRVTNILARDGRMLESIAEKHFCESGITLSGQILAIEYDCGVWYWTQKYDGVAKTAASAHRKRSSGADFSARFSLPVNPSLVEWRGEQVWAFEDIQLRALMDDLWRKCAKDVPEDNIPSCQSSASFPYRSYNSEHVLYHQVATDHYCNSARPIDGTCFICGKKIKIKQKMRIHVGQHLLSLQANLSSAPSSEAMPGNLAGSPCGFCGRAGTCRSNAERQLQPTKTLRVTSNCPYRDALTYSSCPRSSKSNPCTNRPVECPCCPPESSNVWTYALRSHILAIHGPEAVVIQDKKLREYDPTESEFEWMGVTRQNQLVQNSKPTKRKRDTDDRGPSNNDNQVQKRQCTD